MAGAVLGTRVTLRTTKTPMLLGSGRTGAFLQAEESKTAGDRLMSIRTHCPPGEARLCPSRQRAASALPKSLRPGVRGMEAALPSPGPGPSLLATQ